MFPFYLTRYSSYVFYLVLKMDFFSIFMDYDAIFKILLKKSDKNNRKIILKHWYKQTSIGKLALGCKDTLSVFLSRSSFSLFAIWGSLQVLFSTFDTINCDGRLSKGIRTPLPDDSEQHTTGPSFFQLQIECNIFF